MLGRVLNYKVLQPYGWKRRTQFTESRM